jgi:hypothetical protein
MFGEKGLIKGLLIDQIRVVIFPALAWLLFVIFSAKIENILLKINVIIKMCFYISNLNKVTGYILRK